jgi:hypothetical protein
MSRRLSAARNVRHHVFTARSGTLQSVAMDRVSNHRVAGSTNGSTNDSTRDVERPQPLDCRANLARVREGSVKLPKQMRYQTAPCPVPVPRPLNCGPAS